MQSAESRRQSVLGSSMGDASMCGDPIPKASPSTPSSSLLQTPRVRTLESPMGRRKPSAGCQQTFLHSESLPYFSKAVCSSLLHLPSTCWGKATQGWFPALNYKGPPHPTTPLTTEQKAQEATFSVRGRQEVKVVVLFLQSLKK